MEFKICGGESTTIAYTSTKQQWQTRDDAHKQVNNVKQAASHKENRMAKQDAE